MKLSLVLLSLVLHSPQVSARAASPVSPPAWSSGDDEGDDEGDPGEEGGEEDGDPGYKPAPGPVSPGAYGGRRCGNNGDELFCMVCNTYFESGFEPYVGQVQVGRVVMERKRTGRWGRSACSVIYAPKQFSWTFLNRNPVLPRGGAALANVLRASQQAMREGTNGATNYFNFHLVHPSWADRCWQAPIYRQYSQAQIGQHRFLTCPMYLQALEDPLAGGEQGYSELVERYMTNGSFFRFDGAGEPVRGVRGAVESALTR